MHLHSEIWQYCYILLWQNCTPVTQKSANYMPITSLNKINYKLLQMLNDKIQSITSCITSECTAFYTLILQMAAIKKWRYKIWHCQWNQRHVEEKSMILGWWAVLATLVGHQVLLVGKSTTAVANVAHVHCLVWDRTLWRGYSHSLYCRAGLWHWHRSIIWTHAGWHQCWVVCGSHLHYGWRHTRWCGWRHTIWHTYSWRETDVATSTGSPWWSVCWQLHTVTYTHTVRYMHKDNLLTQNCYKKSELILMRRTTAPV